MHPRDSWKSLGQQGDQTSQEVNPEYSLEGLMLKLQYFGNLMLGKIEDRRGHQTWDGWTASPMQWTWSWANSGRWCGAGRPGVLPPTGLQRVGRCWARETLRSYFLLNQLGNLTSRSLSYREEIQFPGTFVTQICWLKTRESLGLLSVLYAKHPWFPCLGSCIILVFHLTTWPSCLSVSSPFIRIPVIGFNYF